MRILILNQYFPPDDAPTGRLFDDLAGHLRQRGHAVTCLGSAQGYNDERRHLSRAKREALALSSILRRGLLAPKCDLVISGSSPPCLLLVARLVALRHCARSLHWAMDLYPDLAVTLGEIRAGAISTGIARLMRQSLRRSEVVSVDADMAALLADRKITSTVIRPWIVDASAFATSEPVPRREPFRWLYSGNLGRAHEWQTLIEAQAILEHAGHDIRLVIQGRGAHRPSAERRAADLGLRQVDFLDYAAPETFNRSLLEAGAIVATQLPETAGMLWPSKLAALPAIPRPLVWIGPGGGSVAREVNARPQSRAFHPGEAEAVANFLIELAALPPTPVIPDLTILAKNRDQALADWVRLIDASKR